MKTEIRKTYFCEHCKKHMLSAASMARHEKYCPSNPENRHRCFDLCRHLKRSRMVGNHGVTTEFECKKLNIKMYSYLLEKKATSYFGCPIKSDGLVRMPLHCIHHESMSESEFEKRFNVDL